MRFGITATVEHWSRADGWHGSRQIPYFELNGDVQGVLSEAQARRIADEIISAGVPPHERHVWKVHVTAVAL